MLITVIITSRHGKIMHLVCIFICLLSQERIRGLCTTRLFCTNTQIGAKWGLILHIILLLVPLFIPPPISFGMLLVEQVRKMWKRGGVKLPFVRGALGVERKPIFRAKGAKEVHTSRSADEAEKRALQGSQFKYPS